MLAQTALDKMHEKVEDRKVLLILFSLVFFMHQNFLCMETDDQKQLYDFFDYNLLTARFKIRNEQMKVLKSNKKFASFRVQRKQT